MTLKKISLSRKILVALGIPSIFVPGMILAAILGWNWENDLSLLAARGGYYVSEKIFPRRATVISALDGDTIQIDNEAIIRLIGINTPDRGEKGYGVAEEYLNILLADQEIELEYDKYQDDKYGRILAYVWKKCTTELGCKDGRRMINWLLVKEGYAKVVIYDDRRKLIYEDYLKSAEN